MEQINQRIGATINSYAEAYNQGNGTISNDLAKKLLNEAFSAEEAEVKLKRSYADKTPNIDRIAKEGALFTDWYAQQSCTAGRAVFITGQVGFRTGLLKVGLPGAKEGLQARDVTIAELLKAKGYKTGQFGKNHLGDRDEHLPTAHGFDEFYGSLYHLNAEEEPEHPDYFKNPEVRKRFATRGVLHSWANPDGTQKIEPAGALTKKRMETVDEEFTREAMRFMEESKKEGKPFFLWWNATRMHIFTHLKATSRGKTGVGIYPDGMVEHDAMVGQLLDKLAQLCRDENTIVMYSTDNGAEKMSWPDSGASPFRGEKNTNWEGGYRAPCVIRWPGVIGRERHGLRTSVEFQRRSGYKETTIPVWIIPTLYRRAASA